MRPFNSLHDEGNLPGGYWWPRASACMGICCIQSLDTCPLHGPAPCLTILGISVSRDALNRPYKEKCLIFQAKCLILLACKASNSRLFWGKMPYKGERSEPENPYKAKENVPNCLIRHIFLSVLSVECLSGPPRPQAALIGSTTRMYER